MSAGVVAAALLAVPGIGPVFALGFGAAALLGLVGAGTGSAVGASICRRFRCPDADVWERFCGRSGLFPPRLERRSLFDRCSNRVVPDRCHQLRDFGPAWSWHEERHRPHIPGGYARNGWSRDSRFCRQNRPRGRNYVASRYHSRFPQTGKQPNHPEPSGRRFYRQRWPRRTCPLSGLRPQSLRAAQACESKRERPQIAADYKTGSCLCHRERRSQRANVASPEFRRQSGRLKRPGNSRLAFFPLRHVAIYVSFSSRLSTRFSISCRPRHGRIDPGKRSGQKSCCTR